MIKNLLLLAGFSTFTVVVIIVVNLYLSLNTSKVTPQTKESIAPINGTFDTETLARLKKRSIIATNLDDKSKVTKSSEKNNISIIATSSAKPSTTITPTKTVRP